MNKLLFIPIIIVFFLRQIIILNANDDTYINTSNITYDEENNIVELAENSKINFDDTNILVDRGIIDYNNDTLEIFGNFYLYQEFNILSGKNLVGNTSLDNFTTSEVSYIYNNDLKIDSDRAVRSDNNITFYNNFLTPCELEGYFNCPTWSLRIDETKYDIVSDKFNHYNTFLQIADYKVFYLPYFSHYGVKAPRQKGFLTPTLEVNLDGNTGFITPYYIPVGENSEIIIKPKLILDNSFNFVDQYTLNTVVNHRNSGGNFFIDIKNKKDKNNSNTYSSIKFQSKQTLNKKNVLSYEALITNSVSTTRSLNEDSVTFEDIFIKLDSYDFLYKHDFLKAEISTVEALDTTNTNFIPLSPSIKYTNQQLIKNNLSLTNNINFINLKRNESNLEKPSDSLFIKFSNSLSSNKKFENYNTYNKLTFINNMGEYSYRHNSNLNDNVFRSNLILSSDTFFNLNKSINSRIKFVTNLNILSDNIINEDSKALTFNYHNQFADSRLYGSDLEDNSTRVIYGLDDSINFMKNNYDIKINQSYDFDSDSNYTNQINQKDNFSDIALEVKTNIDNVYFNFDSRLDNKNLDKKEMNYSLDYSEKIEMNLNYNETDAQAFKNMSMDTQSLGVNLGKKINENIKISMSSDLDLKNDYSPFKQSFNLSLFDECSRLDITYTDERFNDNYNTKPSETISISFHMDYLGFFGYKQKSNLFFDKPGDFNYGM